MVIGNNVVDFNDRGLLINLIKNKYYINKMLDDNFSSVLAPDVSCSDMGYKLELKFDICDVYGELSNIIKTCHFTENRLEILQYLYQGYDFEDISKKMNKQYSTIQSTFYLMLNKIQFMYNQAKLKGGENL